jgi:acyl carrier protein
MTKEKAIEIVQAAILKHEYLSSSNYTLENTFVEIGVDSLDLVEISMIIEDMLEEDVSSEKLDGVIKVKDLVRIVEFYD